MFFDIVQECLKNLIMSDDVNLFIKSYAHKHFSFYCLLILIFLNMANNIKVKITYIMMTQHNLFFILGKLYKEFCVYRLDHPGPTSLWAFRVWEREGRRDRPGFKWGNLSVMQVPVCAVR